MAPGPKPQGERALNPAERAARYRAAHANAAPVVKVRYRKPADRRSRPQRWCDGVAELLELRGTFDHNPKRRRPIGPKSPEGVGEPPACLTETEAVCWREAVGNAPAGVLTSADRWLVEIAARLMARLRSEGLAGLRTVELAALTGALGKLGWTPADRSRVSTAAEPTSDDNPWAKLRALRP